MKGGFIMPTNLGNLKELEVVQSIDNKKVKELSNNMRNLVMALYGVLDGNEIVRCQKIEDYIKPDFVIIYKNQKKYVSMKSGRAETIHQEYVKNFILFLRSLGISTRTQQTILLYQYGDGSLDGTGKNRMDYNKLRLVLDERIKEANEELNKDHGFIMKVITRCLFVGTLEKAIPIDCIYFGDYRFGIVATRKQIERHINRKDWRWMNNLHIGPIQLRPHARYIGKEIKDPEARNKLECYWANLSSDIDYISNRYDY